MIGRARIVVLAAGLWACGDPQLSLHVTGPLLVGQEVSVRITEGDDGAEPTETGLTLRDSGGTTYTAAQLLARKAKPREVAFRIPPGIAAGEGSLDVGTQAGRAFTGPVSLFRAIAVRDQAGGLWLSAIQGEWRSGPIVEVRAQDAGFGSGPLAVSPSGGTLAIGARTDRELRVSWPGATPKITPAVKLSDYPRDLLIGASGIVLVATDQGTYLAEPVGSAAAPKLTETPLLASPTSALARDARGQRGVALVREGSPVRFGLVRLDLAASPPAASPAVMLSWAADQPVTVDVAMAGEGGAVVAVNRAAEAVALLPPEAASAVEQPMPKGESGPIAVAAGTGDLFFTLNVMSRNLSLLRVGSGTPAFTQPFDPRLPVESGVPVGLAVSQRDEAVLLFERELFVYNDRLRLGAVIRLPVLFADKSNAVVGTAVAVQP